MNLVLKALDFCNLLDYNGKLSITNIALVALIAKLALSGNTDWPSLVAVITAFSNYAHKRVVSQGNQDAESGSGNTESSNTTT